MNFSSRGQMRYRTYTKDPKLKPKLVKKEIHGQMVWVKVYPPRWASQKTTDGVPNYLNPKFSGKNSLSYTKRSARRKQRENPAD